RNRSRPGESGVRRSSKVHVELEETERARAGKIEEEVRLAGGRGSAAIQVRRQEAGHARALLETDGGTRAAGQHARAVKSAGLRAHKGAPVGEGVGRPIVGVRPDAELGVVREVAAEVERVPDITAGGV